MFVETPPEAELTTSWRGLWRWPVGIAGGIAVVLSAVASGFVAGVVFSTVSMYVGAWLCPEPGGDVIAVGIDVLMFTAPPIAAGVMGAVLGGILAAVVVRERGLLAGLAVSVASLAILIPIVLPRMPSPPDEELPYAMVAALKATPVVAVVAACLFMAIGGPLGGALGVWLRKLYLQSRGAVTHPPGNRR